jgi:hypothetical protein
MPNVQLSPDNTDDQSQPGEGRPRALSVSSGGKGRCIALWKGDDSGRTQAASLLTRLVSCRSNSAPCHSGNFLLVTRG